MNRTESKRLTFSSQMVFDYYLRPALGENPKELILLLHGFSESGHRIFDKLSSAFSEDVTVLAPNGPFPMPVKTEHGYKAGFSWYFYDPSTQEYFIDMRVAIDFLDHGLKALGLNALPKKIIGFSQGGYLAPFVAHQVGNVRQIVGIGCEYLSDELPSDFSCRVDGIHGELDEVVPLKDAIQSHQRLKEKKIPGTLHTLSGVGHRIDTGVLAKLQEVLKSVP